MMECFVKPTVIKGVVAMHKFMSKKEQSSSSDVTRYVNMCPQPDGWSALCTA